MGELIAAGVKAGLRFWWPGLRSHWKYLVVILLVTPVVLAGPLLFRIMIIAAFGAGYVGSLYNRAFENGELALSDRYRLLKAWFLAILFMGVLSSLFFVVLLSTLYAVASAGRGFDPSQVRTWAPAIDERGRVVAGAVFLIGMAALGWAAMRVWLSSATTIAERRVAMLSTWPFTRNRVVPMIIARVILSAPAALLLFLAFPMLPHDGARDYRSVLLPLTAVMTLAIAWAPLQVGAGAEFYRRRVLPLEPVR